MKPQQQGEYIRIENGCQQICLKICSGNEITVEKDRFCREVSAQLEELDYRELYSAYSGKIRKSQIEPRILFEILVLAYMLGVYSSRGIEYLCRTNIQFLLILDGRKVPDHTTINRFRSGKKTGKAIRRLFEQYVNLLKAKGETDHEVVFIDGTKIESKANRYTFVWRKRVERELAKVKEKLKEKFKANPASHESKMTLKKVQSWLDELNREIILANIEVKKGRGHRRPTIVRLRDEVQELVRRWMAYEEHLQIMGEGRNSYSKTDPDATFMRMKDDHMRNGQLKPGYNVQFAVNSEYITGVGVFSDRTDYATLPPMLKSMEEWQKERYRKVCTDAGYESLENYRYLTEHEQQAYIKPKNYEAKKKRKYKAQIGRSDNMAYYEPGDYFVCKNERMLVRISTEIREAKDGRKRELARYRCEDCHECPYRAACCKAKDIEQQKEIEVCWELERLRGESLERISSEEGEQLRVNRSIQAEGSFAQLKQNRSFRRFLLCGKVKVEVELSLLALSQNLLKYISKRNRNKQKTHLLCPESLLKF